MKISLLSLLCVLLVTGCNTVDSQNNVILFSTEKYAKILQASKLSLEDAKLSVCNAVDKKILLDPEDKGFQQEKHFPLYKGGALQHYVIYKDYYVFTYRPPTHAGTLDITSGVFVHRNSGELVQKPFTQESEKTRVRVGASSSLVCSDLQGN